MFDETAVLPAIPAEAPAPRRRMRGLRLSVLPSLPLTAQVLGGVAALGGTYLKLGLSITLIVGGVAVAVLGMLREAGKI